MRKHPELLPALFAAALLAALTVSLFADALFSNGRILPSGGRQDLPAIFIPWRDFGFSQLRQGNLALWNPHIFSGTPFFGGFESALLYPPNWIHMALGLGTAINLVIVSHVFLAGFFTWLWCRARGLSLAGSLLAGASFMFSGPYFLHIYAGHLTQLCVMAWAPALFLCLDRLLGGGSLEWCLPGMLVVGMQILAGHPQCLYYTAIAAALYTALHLRGAKRPGRICLGVSAIYAGGAALAAVQLLTGLETASESVRAGGLAFQLAGAFSLPPENLLTLAAPRLFGAISRFPYFGRCYYWETSLFLGVVGLVLALYAAVAADRRSTRVPVATVLILVVLALGAHTPLFGALYHWLPGYKMFRGSAKFSFLICLFLSMLAGTGFDRLRSARAWPKGLALLTAAAAASLWGAGQWILRGPWDLILRGIPATGESELPLALYRDPSFMRDSAVFAAHEVFNAGWTLAIAAALLFLMRLERRFAFGLLLLAALDLLHFAVVSRGTTTLDIPYPPAWERTLARDPGDYRVLHKNWMAHPNAAVTMRAYDLWGYSPLISRRYAEFLAFSQGAAPDGASPYLLAWRIPRLFDLLRCRYVFLDDPGQSVLRRPDAMPRLQLVRDWAVIPDRQGIFRALADPNFDPRRKVLLESAPAPAPTPGRSRRLGSATAVRSSTDELEISAELPEPAILLITDAYSAGWRARPLPGSVQGRYEVLPADYTLQAVPLAAGRHHLRIEYSPLSYRIGKWITLVSLLVLAAFGLRRLGRWRPG